MQYPKGEIVWLRAYDSGHQLQYIITSKPLRDSYFFYAVQEDKFVKRGKGVDPKILEEKYCG